MEFFKNGDYFKYGNRFNLWSAFIQTNNIKTVAEIGVYKGEFAEFILKNCEGIERYIMIDPWRSLDDWNKPANAENKLFNKFHQETLNRTKFAENKVQILRGKTTEVAEKICDSSLDLAYIDGDHTLKGITIDLMQIWDKLKANGFIAGDDFCPSVWQHDMRYEPTLVFPFAVYFAEAMDVKIYALPFNQFVISKREKGFEFVDFANGIYKNKNLLSQLKGENRVKTTYKNFLRKLF